MDIINRISAIDNAVFKKLLDDLQVKYKYDDLTKSIVLVISEKDPHWLQIEKVAQKEKLVVLRSFKFSKAEMNAAEWFYINSVGHFGYPMPDNDFGFIEASYDTANYCKRCGMGRIQNAPFRISSAPKQKTKTFHSLHWIYDEYFISNEAMQVLEEQEISGVEFSKVVQHRSGKNIDTIFQIKVKDVISNIIDRTNLETVTCIYENEEFNYKWDVQSASMKNETPYCGNIKFKYPEKDVVKFHESKFDNLPDIFKSKEYFGSGGEAHKLVIISKKLYDLILDKKWKGLKFTPVIFQN